MENFEAWVSRESEKLGLNFASLDLEARNRLLEELMSGLENGFRSRMDSPDLRFGKRRNIIKARLDDNENSNQYDSSNADSILTTTNSTNCLNDINCSDSGQACINCNCTNYGYQAHCTDSDQCMDRPCKNANIGECSDQSECFDDMCGNSDANLSSNCSDDHCCDNACYDKTSGMAQTCSDANQCNDAQCINYGEQGCYDESNQCSDNICANWGGSPATECSGEHDEHDGKCTNQPYCRDYGCREDTDSGCLDGCNGDQANGSSNRNNNVCLDTGVGCTDDGGCVNSTNCIDNMTCIDTVGCGNSTQGQCIDLYGCSDNLCNNASFCTDIGSCNDFQCQNELRCTDIGTCTDSSCSNSIICSPISDDPPPSPS